MEKWISSTFSFISPIWSVKKRQILENVDEFYGELNQAMIPVASVIPNEVS